jgi:hypothetical protein
MVLRSCSEPLSQLEVELRLGVGPALDESRLGAALWWV